MVGLGRISVVNVDMVVVVGGLPPTLTGTLVEIGVGTTVSVSRRVVNVMMVVGSGAGPPTALEVGVATMVSVSVTIIRVVAVEGVSTGARGVDEGEEGVGVGSDGSEVEIWSAAEVVVDEGPTDGLATWTEVERVVVLPAPAAGVLVVPTAEADGVEVGIKVEVGTRIDVGVVLGSDVEVGVVLGTKVEVGNSVEVGATVVEVVNPFIDAVDTTIVL